MNHDHPESHQHDGTPRESVTYRPLSPWLVGAFMITLLWGGLYLGFHSGGFRQDVYESNAVNWAGGGAVAALPPDPKVVGKRLYSQNCIVCHQANGMGVAGQFPPLVDSEWVLSDAHHADNQLVLLLLNGHQGVMQVKGQNYNNAMPPWKQLSDDQIAAILTYIRSDWGNKAPAIDATFVAQVRKGDTQSDPWTQQQLLAVPEVKDAGTSASKPAAK